MKMSSEKEMPGVIPKETPLEVPKEEPMDVPDMNPTEMPNRMGKEGGKNEVKDFQDDPGLIMVPPRRL